MNTRKQLDEFVAFPGEIIATKQARYQRLVQLKAIYREDLSHIKSGGKVYRLLAQEGKEEAITSIDRRVLISLMRSLRTFAESPIKDYSTEYYSACGMDDYQCDLRHSARIQAIFLQRMIFNQ